MVKYARFVYEIEIDDNTIEELAAVKVNEALQEYISNNTVMATDIEISDTPYWGERRKV
jgi:hypothetical protein